MTREGMPEHMRANPRGGDPSRRGAGLEIAGKRLARQVAACAVGGKQPRPVRRRGMRIFEKREIGRDSFARRAGKRHQPLPPSLAPDMDKGSFVRAAPKGSAMSSETRKPVA